MEYGSRLRFAIFVVLGILVLVFSVWGLASIARNLLGGSKSSTGNNKQTKIVLNDYAKPGTVVKYVARGPIVAQEKYQSYEIDVAQDYREIKVFSGYDGSVVIDKRYTNTNASYQEFLKALRNYSFTAKNSGVTDDNGGQCPTGNRYEYSLNDQGQDVVHTWSGSCTNGSFAGSASAVRALIRAQIPDFSKVTNGIFI